MGSEWGLGVVGIRRGFGGYGGIGEGLLGLGAVMGSKEGLWGRGGGEGCLMGGYGVWRVGFGVGGVV